jgi:hypothetical protein
MEQKSYWLCECGKQYEQPLGTVKFPIREICECGKELYKIKDPDGIVTEFVNAEDWFIKEFDEHQNKMTELDIQFRKLSWQREMFNKTITEVVEKIKAAKKTMDNIVEAGARRTKDRDNHSLLKRTNMAWNFIREMRKWAGREKEAAK